MDAKFEVFVEFNGNAKEAFEFYQKVFKADNLEIMQIKDAPSDEGMEAFDPESVAYASLSFGNTMLMGSDNFEGNYQEPKGIYLTWSTKSPEEVKQVWKCFVDAGSEVVMDLAETYWSKAYGILKDPYGVSWMIQTYEDMEIE